MVASILRERRDHEVEDPAALSDVDWVAVGGFSVVSTRPVRGSTGRVSRGPPLRPMASIGGGGRTPALNRIRWTGSEACAPTDNQYLEKKNHTGCMVVNKEGYH
ncbi:unnamed protein product [Linum trigynum]|uniref:Uncharacterized protein n=1 Tax=Linum trigynum TaxID=586398 RepID=A0AAV2GTI5_9ROSI